MEELFNEKMKTIIDNYNDLSDYERMLQPNNTGSERSKTFERRQVAAIVLTI